MAIIEDRLQERGWLLADGATGTNLFDRGLTSGEAPELWNADRPAEITRLYRNFTDAGADIILTNSFGGTSRRLRLHNAHPRVHELNMRAAALARDVADRAGRKILVGGSVGPTGDLFAPLGELTETDAVDIFAEQIEGLKAGGADVIWIETMSAIEEMRAAADAATLCGMEFIITASFDSAGMTMMGLSPAAMATSTLAFPTKPHAVGCNCGVGASDLVCSVLAITEAEPAAIVIAKANCGVPRVKGDSVVYTGTPELMADYARLARDAGARIIGGCCGTSPIHLAAMRDALDRHTTRARPDLETVVAALGPLVSPPSTAVSTRRPNRRYREG